MGLSQTYLLRTVSQDVKMWEMLKPMYCVDNEMGGKGRGKDRVVHLGLHVLMGILVSVLESRGVSK